MWPFLQQTLLLEIVLAISWFVGVADAIICVQCSSDDDSYPGRCQKNPPPAVQCHGSSGPEVQFCLVAREKDKQGNIIRFVRDCAPEEIDNCALTHKEPPQPYQVCYDTCRGDACNHASTHAPPPSAAVLVTLSLSVAFLVSAGYRGRLGDVSSS